MSRLSRKDSRPITVDGRTFRWMLKGRSRFIGNAPVNINITIQEDLGQPENIYN